MMGRIWRRWRSVALFTPMAAAAVMIALAVGSSPAQAFWVGVGPCCGYWGPAPYWGYPPPYAYAPARAWRRPYGHRRYY